MRGRGPVDFTQGNIIGSIVLFSVPIVLGELFQNLYNSVDALVVGNLVSDSALAAVSVCSMIANLIVNFFNGVSVGSNVVVSLAFGEGDAGAPSVSCSRFRRFWASRSPSSASCSLRSCWI